MKKILYVLVLLFFQFGFSQNLTILKNSDTIFILFDNSKYETETNYKTKESTKDYFKNKKIYTFSLDSDNTIDFRFNDYKNIEDYEKGIKTDVKTVRKRFLKKNKEKILDINFFIKNGFLETFNAIYVPHKVIYLIDSKEIKGRNVILKEVTISAPNFTPE